MREMKTHTPKQLRKVPPIAGDLVMMQRAEGRVVITRFPRVATRQSSHSIEKRRNGWKNLGQADRLATKNPDDRTHPHLPTLYNRR